MLIRQPADEDRDPATPRSGHGAASVIPYISRERQLKRECDPDDAGVDDAQLAGAAEPTMPAKLRWER